MTTPPPSIVVSRSQLEALLRWMRGDDAIALCQREGFVHARRLNSGEEKALLVTGGSAEEADAAAVGFKELAKT